MSDRLGKIVAVACVYTMAVGLWGVFSAIVFKTTLAESGNWLLLALPGLLVVGVASAYIGVYIPWRRGKQALKADHQKEINDFYSRQ
jgi:predicted tellurium resistance membrane protein TerC